MSRSDTIKIGTGFGGGLLFGFLINLGAAKPLRDAIGVAIAVVVGLTLSTNGK